MPVTSKGSAADVAARMAQLQHGVRVGVGIHADEGARVSEDAVQVIDYAAWNEFGTATIPERSFVRAWFDERQAVAQHVLKKLLQDVAQRGADLDQALAKFAVWVEADMRARIRRGILPENAPSTIQAKGSSKPLINHGILIASIKGKVLQ